MCHKSHEIVATDKAHQDEMSLLRGFTEESESVKERIEAMKVQIEQSLASNELKAT